MGDESLRIPYSSRYSKHVSCLQAKSSALRFLWMGRRRLDAQLGRRKQNDGVTLAADSVICNEEPDDELRAACIELEKAIC